MAGLFRAYTKIFLFTFGFLFWSVFSYYNDGISGGVYIGVCMLLLVAGSWWIIRGIRPSKQDLLSCGSDCPG